MLLLLIVSALLTICISGCATANGFGKDMQGAGEDIQRETK